jgi:hypothetical protein
LELKATHNPITSLFFTKPSRLISSIFIYYTFFPIFQAISNKNAWI